VALGVVRFRCRILIIHPVIVTGADGVGSKMEVLLEHDMFSTAAFPRARRIFRRQHIFHRVRTREVMSHLSEPGGRKH